MQKIAIGACVVHFLEKDQTHPDHALDLIATYSFALYFLHDFILFTFQNLLFTFFRILLPESLFFVSLFTFFCEVALCLLLIMGIKNCSAAAQGMSSAPDPEPNLHRPVPWWRAVSVIFPRRASTGPAAAARGQKPVPMRRRPSPPIKPPPLPGPSRPSQKQA